MGDFDLIMLFLSGENVMHEMWVHAGNAICSPCAWLMSLLQ